MPQDSGLRVALLVYRGNPHSGGQGVYTRHLARALVGMGHRVEVFAGQPYPELDPGVDFTPVPSLDMYRPDDPFRVPHPREFRDWIDVLEYATVCTAAFPEPLTFSLRARRLLKPRLADFDIVHDNQCLGYGILDIQRAGFPVIGTIHHPITVDRDLEMTHATSIRRKISMRRFYSFTRMQVRVARQIPRLITVSESSRRDLKDEMGIELEKLAVVPVGVDHEVFRPLPDVARVPGRILAMASADVPLKGVRPLLQAIARLRQTRPVELVIVSRPREGSDTPAFVRKLGLEDTVRFVNGITEEELVRHYAEAEVAVVPSLYEGFSLPAVQAMASGLPLVATTAGALPEVIGRHGEHGLLVTPGDSAALAAALDLALGDADLRARLADAARTRALARYSWEATAAATVEQYRILLDSRQPTVFAAPAEVG
ncbi:MAG TPA: glycosyltransferase family 4 protein [Candidatus Dormibacteraeota bacterium]|jgi:glycosyltransferase involved in cell wall biosynthesis|nr:glycosyltransferase family 4 protein [Candidatus Dormibacteraeota bacterium]